MKLSGRARVRAKNLSLDYVAALIHGKIAQIFWCRAAIVLM